MSKLYKVKIILKSGAVIETSLEKFSLQYRDNTVTNVTWTNGKDKILYLDPNEIAAVISR